MDKYNKLDKFRHKIFGKNSDERFLEGLSKMTQQQFNDMTELREKLQKEIVENGKKD